MKRQIKELLKSICLLPYYFSNLTIGAASIFSIRIQELAYDYQLKYLDSQKKSIKHMASNSKSISLTLFTPNSLCKFRAETFSTKEPETLLWIEEFGSDSALLFDIGANIGLYSLYHNIMNNGESIAFEPSFFNLKLLIKNININSCQNLTTVVTNPLSDKEGINNFKYGSSAEGGAMSAFGVNYGFDGNQIYLDLEMNVIGMSLDWMFQNNILSDVPDLMKIDVDGIEHLILRGAINLLKESKLKSILVEVNDDFEDQRKNVQDLLDESGFFLRNKLHSEMVDNSTNYSQTYNQIWVRGDN